MRHGFRSGLEVQAADEIKRETGKPAVFETLHVPYVIPASLHKYTPDFLLPNGIIVETKGIFDKVDRAKHLLVRAAWPDLDIRIVFQNPHAKIYPKSPTEYCDWCDANGIKWAGVEKVRGKGIVRVVPLAWYAEKGPKIRPEVVLKGRPRE